MGMLLGHFGVSVCQGCALVLLTLDTGRRVKGCGHPAAHGGIGSHQGERKESFNGQALEFQGIDAYEHAAASQEPLSA